MSVPPVQSNPRTNKRSRIVVNLDRAGDPSQASNVSPQGQPPGQGPYISGAKRRRRWPIVLAAVLLLLIVGGFVFWQVYKTRPSYSLALLVDAAQRDDAAAFDQVVDTGKVIESFAPQVVDEATGRLGSALTPQMRQRIEALVPTLIPNVTVNLRSEVMKQVREVTARAEGKPFFLIALSIPYIVDIRREGDTAIVRAKRADRDIELSMQRTPEKRWKVVGVRDAELARRIVDDIARYLPAVGGDLENEIRRQIDKGLPGILPGGRRR
jgi:hypothetical protein